MDPEFRKRLGVVISSSAIAASFLPTPAFAQTVNSTLMFGAAPTAIAAGAVGFGVISAFFALQARKQSAKDQNATQMQVAAMRAQVDAYEALLANMPEVNVLWATGQDQPRVFGNPDLLCGPGSRASVLLDFRTWLENDDCFALSNALKALKSTGNGFALNLTTLDGKAVRALGQVSGTGAVLKLRLASDQALEKLTEHSAASSNTLSDGLVSTVERHLPLGISGNAGAQTMADGVKSILTMLQKPAWIRDAKGELIFANSAYMALAHKMSRAPSDGAHHPEIFTPDQLVRQKTAISSKNNATVLTEPLPDHPEFELVLFPLEEGSAGYLGPRNVEVTDSQNESMAHISGVIGALNSPVVVFDAQGRLEHFNGAYLQLWGFERAWLNSGQTEKTILDKMRSRDQLPSTPNYQTWRDEHLKSYQLSEPLQETWHMQDGRTINYVAAPAGADGGVIYVFEDVTERLRLETTNNSLVHVQRETLNALSEAVAVFSPDGRLRLHNPQMSRIWKLPINQLDLRPHIDQMAEICSQAWPEDGLAIWQKLKRSVLDLHPNRQDGAGRINRSDGCLIEYAVTRMPDGQTMLTFVDVTQSANYERMLKERNDALVTADNLKDAFVQSVSYELRSPLTNIIGFADLLASDDFGPLNETQKQYAGYIRASSATLGVLIDNILDLSHVDAGIAELELQTNQVADLVEKARTGLTATFAGTDDQQSLNLVVDMAPDLPELIVDGTRVVQILYNLLSSASRFSEPGSKIVLRVRPQGEWIKFTIEDEGVGVPDELRELLERPADQSTEGRQRGAALGLSIVNAFVRMHGGSISVDQRQPRGTIVSVNLPVDASKIASPPDQRVQVGRSAADGR